MTGKSTRANPPGIDIIALSGAQIAPHIADLARLRMTVFADFPYLYDGSPEYEAQYLQTYAGSPRSLFVLALDGGKVIGAATGTPLTDETEEVRAPFEAAGWPIEEIFYFGESVLLPAWRGRGIGVAFFSEREAYARSLPGIRWCAFCAVERPADHPARPAGYQPLDAFWRRRGYRHHPELRTTFSWTDIGDPGETEKPMSFWLRPIAD